MINYLLYISYSGAQKQRVSEAIGANEAELVTERILSPTNSNPSFPNPGSKGFLFLGVLSPEQEILR